MDGCSAPSGSCTRATPPLSLIAQSPAVPSSSAPVSTMPITRCPWAAAAERNSTSMAGRERLSFGPRVTRTRSVSIMRWRSAAATTMRPGRIGSPSLAVDTDSGVQRPRMSARRLRVSGATCMTMYTAASRSRGRPLTSVERAVTPPAEVPITTIRGSFMADFAWPELHGLNCRA